MIEINPTPTEAGPRKLNDSDSLICKDNDEDQIEIVNNDMNDNQPVVSTVNRILLSSSSSNIPPELSSNRLVLSDSDETNCSTVSDSENPKRIQSPRKDLETEMEKLELVESEDLFSQTKSDEKTILHIESQKRATTNVSVARLSQQFDSLNIGQKRKSIYLSGTTISNTPVREIVPDVKNEAEESKTEEGQDLNQTVITLSSTSGESEREYDEIESDDDDERSIEREIILISDSEGAEEQQCKEVEKSIATGNRVPTPYTQEESSFHGSIVSTPDSSHIGLSPSVMARVDQFFNEIPPIIQNESSASSSIKIPDNLSYQSIYVSETSAEPSFSSALDNQIDENKGNAKDTVQPIDQEENLIRNDPIEQTPESVPEIHNHPATPKPSDLVKNTPTDLASANVSNLTLTPQSNQKINITAKINIKIHVPLDETSSENSITSEENDENPDKNETPQKRKETLETSSKGNIDKTPQKQTSSAKKIPPVKTPTQKTPIKSIPKRTPTANIEKSDAVPFRSSPRKTPTSSAKKGKNKTIDPYHCETIRQNLPIDQSEIENKPEPKPSQKKTPRKVKYQIGDPYYCAEDQSEPKENPSITDNPSIKENLFKTPKVGKSKTAKAKDDNENTETVIDDASIAILDQLYGDTWKIPDLLRKCAPSTRKPQERNLNPVNQNQNNVTMDTTFANEFYKRKKNLFLVNFRL